MIAGKDKELKLLDTASAEFARKELAPGREVNDKYPFGPFFDHVLEKAHELDFSRVLLPEEFGGIGHGISGFCIVLSNICREDASLGGILFTGAAAHELLMAAGAADLLRAITSGGENVRDFLVALPVFNNPSEIEPVANARMESGQWKLTGAVEYVVLGGIAGHALVPARTGGDEEFSWFLVDPAAEGVTRSGPVLSLGLHACPAVDMVFDHVPARLVGEAGAGKACFDRMADRMALPAAGMALGIMKGSFREAFAYTKGRFQGGRRLVDWSEVRMTLADLAVKIRCAEMILSRGCQAADADESGWRQSAAAAAVRVRSDACDLTTDGIQLLGGVGYMKDYGQEKRFRDAKQVQALLGLAPLKKMAMINDMIGIWRETAPAGKKAESVAIPFNPKN